MEERVETGFVGKEIIKDSNFRCWRDGSVIKSACCSETTTTGNPASGDPLPLASGIRAQPLTRAHPPHTYN